MVARRKASYVGPAVAGGALIATGILIAVIYANAPEKKVPVVAAVIDAGAPIAAPTLVPDAGEQIVAALGGTTLDAGMLAAVAVDAGSTVAAVAATGGDEETVGEGPPGLDIETSEGVTILLDEVEIGVGSAVVRTTPGKHILKLVDRDGRTMRKAIWVPEKGTRKLKLSTGKAYVTIDAPEGSLVKIDGKSIGYAPIRGQVPVMSGPHEIEVMVGKAKWEESFKVKDGQKIHFNVGREHR